MQSVVDYLLTEPAYIWLLLGAALICFEILTVPGVGFLFAGLAAFTVGLALGIGLLDGNSIIMQIAVFMVTMGIWAAVLWRPLKNFLHKPSAGVPYSNIVGTTGTVMKPGLERGKSGEVKWSGAVMRAEIWSGVDLDEIPSGTEVEVAEVAGNLLRVKPKNMAPDAAPPDEPEEEEAI